MRKMSKAVEEIENYDSNIIMRIQLMLEVYVYRQKLLKKSNSMIPFYGQDWEVSRFCGATGLYITFTVI